MPPAKAPATRGAVRTVRPTAKTASSSSSVASTGTARRVASAAMTSDLPIPAAEPASKAAPAREVSTTRDAVAGPSRPAETAQIPAKRPAVTRPNTVRQTPSAQAESSDRSASLLKEISEPTRCSSDSVKTAHAILPLPAKGEDGTTAADIKITARQVHFAKQVVNATIQALNELVTAAWRLEASASKGGPAVTSSNIKCLLQCFRHAVRFLHTAAVLTENDKGSIKDVELRAIVLSISRKTIALQLFDLALDLLKSLALRLGLRVREDAPYFIALPDDDMSSMSLLQVLEGQALTHLAHTHCKKPMQIGAHLSGLLRDPQGVHAWQSFVRSRRDLSADDYKAADRALYTVEKAVMSLIDVKNQATPPHASDILACRSASLHLLLLASDVDMGAFWGRTARIGASYMRSTLADKTHSSSKERLSAFEPVHALFRDIVLRAGQSEPISNKSDAFSQPYDAFCDQWMAMARRAGDDSAIRYIAEQRSSWRRQESLTSIAVRNDSVDPDEAFDSAITALALASVHMTKMLDDGETGSALLQEAVIRLTAVSTCFTLVGETKRQACSDAVDTARRQCSRILDLDSSVGRQSAKSNAESSRDIIKLATALATYYEDTLLAFEACMSEEKPAPSESIYTACLQLCRLAARSATAFGDDRKKDAAHSLLQRAQRVAALASRPALAIPAYAHKDALRHLASSWHNCGAQLYSDKDPQSAIRFLKAAAECAELGVMLVGEAATPFPKEAMLAHEADDEMLSKKWEHLALCCRCVGQKRDAETYYIKAVLAVPMRLWEAITTRAASVRVEAVFADDAASDGTRTIREIATMATALFELQAYELFSFASESSENRQTMFEVLERANPCTPAEAICALRGHCLLSMGNTMHREGAPAVAMTLNEAQVRHFNLSRYPIRRAQALLHKVQLITLMPKLGISVDLPKLLSECQVAMSAEVQASADKDLAALKPQLDIELSMLKVLLVQSRQIVSDGRGLINEVEALVNKLRGLADLCVPQPVSARAEDARPVLRKTIAPRQTKQALPPRTPVRKKPQLSPRKASTAPARASTNEAQQSSMLDIEWSLLELVCDTVASHGALLPALRLCEAASSLAQHNYAEDACDFRIRILARLVQLYVNLESRDSAAAVVATLEAAKAEVNKSTVARSARCKAALAIASYYSFVEDFDKCQSILEPEQKYIGEVLETDRSNTWHSVLERCEALELQATAAATRADVARAHGDLVVAVKESVNSVRLGLKGGAIISQLCNFRNASTDRDDPFAKPVDADNSNQHDAAQCAASIRPIAPRLQFSTLRLASLSRRTTSQILHAYLLTCRLYMIRGSARDAELLASEAVDFACKTMNDLSTAQALCLRSRLRLEMNLLQEAEEDMLRANAIQGVEHDAILAIHGLMTSAGHASRMMQYDEALETLRMAHTAVGKAERELKSISTGRRQLQASPARKISSTHSPQLSTVSTIVQMMAVLLHVRNCTDEGIKMLEDTSKTQPHMAGHRTAKTLGQLRLSQLWERLSKDPMSALSREAVLLFPRCLRISGHNGKSRHSTAGPTSLDTGSVLNQILANLDILVSPKTRPLVDSAVLRDANVLSAAGHVSQTVLQQGTPHLPDAPRIVDLLDGSMSIALERELLDAIQAKIDRQDLTKSRTRSPFRAEKQSLKKGRTSARLIDSDADDSDNEYDATRDDGLAHWLKAKTRRAMQASDTMPWSMPHGTSLISMSFCHERNCLLVTWRGATDTDGHIVVLPIDRHSRQDEDEEVLSAEQVFEELKEIIEESNTATHSAKDLDGLPARKDWWTRRRALDTRLKDLLTRVESCWLGAFKGLFLPRRAAAREVRETLAQAVNSIITRACQCDGAHNRGTSVQVDSFLVDCLAALRGSQVSDEELEDFLHFALDACQLHGLPVAIDEVDLDLGTADLRTALEAFSARCETTAEDDVTAGDHHTYLILDKDLQGIPWESLPSFRQHAFSRVPSISFLQDRLAALHGEPYTLLGSSMRKWYLLNPSEDLRRTQDRFLPYFKTQKGRTSVAQISPNGNLSAPQSAWRGISGHAPSLDELANALESNDLVLYFGHGGAEQYIRPSRLRSMERCAVTMLWGCSSGVLHDMGDYDRCGTPYNYMLAGCPSLVANLWDATDKELDGVSESVLKLMGIIDTSVVDTAIPQRKATPDAYSSSSSASSEAETSRNAPRKQFSKADKHEALLRSKPKSIAQAVAQSRDACKLPYLTGAACVVYGIPVYYDGTT